MTRRLRFLSSPSPAGATPPRADQFRAVEIRCQKSCCDAVRPLNGQRYLRDEAPLLPLRDCDRPRECACSYSQRADRRRGPRRSAETGFQPSCEPTQAERRRGEGRRQTDHLQEEIVEDVLADTYCDYIAKKRP